jgi:hypothetical protein
MIISNPVGADLSSPPPIDRPSADTPDTPIFDLFREKALSARVVIRGAQ